MKSILIAGAIIIAAVINSTAQNTINVIVADQETKEPLPGASVQVKGTASGAVTNADGRAELSDIPSGKISLIISFVGYEKQTIKIDLSSAENRVIEVFLEEHEEELEQIIVTSTRVSRTIDDIPTRVETISMEEIDEKANMRPTNVSMLLHESTGIQVQQTSYTSATQTVRIQGLDGKYTQLLKDGFPNYSGFSSGLSILDIPPLDLRQVEIIKGSSSTLYGGGAIAGVINFVTREPNEDGEVNLIVNQTSAMGTDFGSFISNRNEKIGFTFLGTAHYQKEFDVDDDHFTELPRQKEFTVFPKLFLYPNERSKIILGHSFTMSDRLGGDVLVIRDEAEGDHQYFEKNQSYRHNTYFTYETNFSNDRKLMVRQSFNYFDRELSKPSYLFSGGQTIAYTDVSYIIPSQQHTFVLGANFIYDAFREGRGTDEVGSRDQTQETISVYGQDNWDITEEWLVEAGLRLDHNLAYSTYLLPRLSVLYKITENFSARLGGGMGYKTPTLFVEETESLFFEDVLPLADDLIAEKSYGSNLDFNYTIDFTERLSLQLNQLFFYTEITDPLILSNKGTGQYAFVNENGPVRTKGFETNARLLFDPFKLFVGYTYVDARATYEVGDPVLALSPHNRLNLIFLVEEHGKYKLGLEGYWTDRQYLNSGRMGRAYWELGFFAEKVFNKISLYINFENFTDTRQNRFEQVVYPPHAHPEFEQVYMHTEGFIVNGGVKVRI